MAPESQISEKSSVGLDLVSSDSKGNISVQTTAEEDPFDPLRTDLKNAKVHFDHEINKHWSTNPDLVDMGQPLFAGNKLN